MTFPNPTTYVIRINYHDFEGRLVQAKEVALSDDDLTTEQVVSLDQIIAAGADVPVCENCLTSDEPCHIQRRSHGGLMNKPFKVQDEPCKGCSFRHYEHGFCTERQATCVKDAEMSRLPAASQPVDELFTCSICGEEFNKGFGTIWDDAAFCHECENQNELDAMHYGG